MTSLDSTQSSQMPTCNNIRQCHSYESDGDQNEYAKAQIIFDLIEDHQWEAVVQYMESNPQAAKCRHRVPNSIQYNLPLHEVCRRQPPVHVINLLLQLYDDAVHTPGQYGFLPLHIACGSGASYEVVTRLLEVFPAATRCRDDVKDALPLHLAAEMGASEDVLMEILTTHPEGSLIRDAAGKTPLDRAKNLPEGETKQYAISALETAPILVATSKSATRRMEQEIESKIRSLEEAHKEYIRQLDKRHDDERTEFLQLQVQFHNDLAAEKERNCELAEALIKLQEEYDLIETKNQEVLNQRLQEQQKKFDAQYTKQKDQIRDVLQSLNPNVTTSNNKDRSLDESIKTRGDLDWNKSSTTDCADTTSSPLSTTTSSSQPDNDLENISRLVTDYNNIKAELVELKEKLFKQDSTVKDMKEAIEKKEQQCVALSSQLEQESAQREQAVIYLRKLAAVHKATLQELNTANHEIDRLNKQSEIQQQQLQDSRRILHEQDKRMENIKSLIASLSHNIDAWTNQPDAQPSLGIQKEELEDVHDIPTADFPIPEFDNPNDKTPNVSLDYTPLTNDDKVQTTDIDEMEKIQDLSDILGDQTMILQEDDENKEMNGIQLEEITSNMNEPEEPINMENIQHLSAIFLEESGHHSFSDDRDYIHEVHVSVDEEGNDEENLGMEVTVLKPRIALEGFSEDTEETALTSDFSNEGPDDEISSHMGEIVSIHKID